MGYCACHAGNYQRAHEAYEEILSGTMSSSLRRGEGKDEGKEAEEKPPREVHLYAACCLFYMQSYEEAEKTRRMEHLLEQVGRQAFVQGRGELLQPYGAGGPHEALAPVTFLEKTPSPTPHTPCAQRKMLY